MFSKLKRLSMRKFAMSSAALFAMLLIYLIPSNPKLDIKEELEYVDSDITESSIFLLDQNSYVALTSVPISSEDIVTKAKGLLKTSQSVVWIVKYQVALVPLSRQIPKY